jgi:hypothetical protein
MAEPLADPKPNQSGHLPTSLAPTSLTGHVVPTERLELIHPHMATLAQMALKVSDMLPLSADVGDFAATLNRDAQHHRDGA